MGRGQNKVHNKRGPKRVQKGSKKGPTKSREERVWDVVKMKLAPHFSGFTHNTHLALDEFGVALQHALEDLWVGG